MKNFRKVLRNVSEADYERFYKIPKYGEVRGKLSLSKQNIVDFEKTYIRFLVNIFISVI